MTKVTQDRTRINRQIRVPKVRLINQDGENLGVMDTRKALDVAGQANLDLVEISPNADPPVCKITDYGKWRYEQQRKPKAPKTKPPKELRLSVRVGEADYQTKIKRASKWLESGQQVQVRVVLKGREKAHPALADELLDRIVGDLDAYTLAHRKPAPDAQALLRP